MYLFSTKKTLKQIIVLLGLCSMQPNDHSPQACFWLFKDFLQKEKETRKMDIWQGQMCIVGPHQL
jgi:hypothetical protein